MGGETIGFCKQFTLVVHRLQSIAFASLSMRVMVRWIIDLSTAISFDNSTMDLQY